ncbi:MAG: TolC family protein [Fimbriimonadaceae bacterium]|nr:TolC family protein [Chitinophagales bacterium]
MNKHAIVILLLISSVKLFGQQTLLLSDAVAAALKNNYEILIEKNNYSVDEINYNASQNAVLPTVNLLGSDIQEFNNVNQKYSNGSEVNQKGAGSNSLSLGLAAEFPLFNGFRIYATKNKMEELLAEGENNLNAQIQNTIAAMQFQYFNVIAQQKYLSALQQSLKLSEQRLDIAQSRKDAGLAANNEVYLAQIDMNNSRQATAEQELIISQAITDLNNILNFPADSTYTIEDTIILNGTINYDVMKNMLLENPSFIALNYAVKASAWTEKETKSYRLPSVALIGGYDYLINRSDAGFFLVNQNYGPYIGVTLNVPIYNAGIYKSQYEVSQLNTENLRLQQENLLSDLDASLYKAWISYENNLKQLELGKENLTLAKLHADLELERYELNQSTIIELREAQQVFEDVNYKYVTILYNAKASEIELLRLTGKLTP